MFLLGRNTFIYLMCEYFVLSKLETNQFTILTINFVSTICLQHTRSKRFCNEIQSIDKDVMPYLLRKNEHGVALGNDTIKGKCVIATRQFKKKEFVLNYKGDLISKKEGDVRFKKYHIDLGSYLYFFECMGKRYCIDATHNDHIGRYVNHSARNPNVCAKVTLVKDLPRLYFVALNDINAGTAIEVDYGVRDKSFSWLSNS